MKRCHKCGWCSRVNDLGLIPLHYSHVECESFCVPCPGSLKIPPQELRNYDPRT